MLPLFPVTMWPFHELARSWARQGSALSLGANFPDLAYRQVGAWTGSPSCTHIRPHSSLGYRPPAPAATVVNSQPTNGHTAPMTAVALT